MANGKYPGKRIAQQGPVARGSDGHVSALASVGKTSRVATEALTIIVTLVSWRT